MIGALLYMVIVVYIAAQLMCFEVGKSHNCSPGKQKFVFALKGQILPGPH